MDNLNGAKMIIELLHLNGIDTVFGVPGGHCLSLYNAINDHPHVKEYSGRNEQGASLMAYGYTRATGKPCCIITTAGPGVTNVITAVAQSHAESVPILVIAVNNHSTEIDHEWGIFHQLSNIRDIFKSITSWSARVSSVENIPILINRAVTTLRYERPRPVMLEVPSNILIEENNRIELMPSQINYFSAINDNLIDGILNEIMIANSPIIYCGGGCIASNCGLELQQLSEFFHIPVITTVQGKGILPEDHPLSLGVMWDRVLSNDKLAEEADLVIALGTSLSRLSTRNGKLPFNKKLIQIDIDHNVIGRLYSNTTGIVGDVKIFLMQILKEVQKRKLNMIRKFPQQKINTIKEEWESNFKSKIPEVWNTLNAIRRATPKDAIIINDMTIPGYWSERYLPVYSSRTSISSYYFGTLGHALPTALGSKIGCKHKPVLAIIGDGGMLFNPQEMNTAIRYGLNIVILLFNDNCYSAVKSAQKSMYNREIDAHQLTNVDFTTMAKAFGWHTIQSNNKNIETDLSFSFRLNKPVLIEVNDILLPLHNDVKF